VARRSDSKLKKAWQSLFIDPAVPELYNQSVTRDLPKREEVTARTVPRMTGADEVLVGDLPVGTLVFEGGPLLALVRMLSSRASGGVLSNEAPIASV
jgi:hypothetical protein